MSRRRKGKKAQRPKGFSSSFLRPLSEIVPRGTGMRGRQKRQYFNELSGAMVFGAGVACAVGGFSLLGVPGAIIGTLCGAGLMSKYVVKNRYFR
jgi:hypothetical protein